MAPSVIALVVLALLVIWLAASEAAVRSIARLQVRDYLDRQLGGEEQDAPLTRPRQLIAAASAGMAAVLALVGMAIAEVAGASGWAVALVALLVGVATAAASIVAGALARRWETRLAPWLAPALQAASVGMRPLLRGAAAVASPWADTSTLAPAKTDADLEDLLREGELDGLGDDREIEIMAGVMQFGDRSLRDVMTPRTEVFAVDSTMAPREVAMAMALSGYSRVPVYRESLDDIIGMLHVFDVLKAEGEGALPLRPVVQAPASKACSEILVDMLRTRRHLVVVLDEYGGTAGIATLEDVLEELVGDIRDEHDEPAGPELAANPTHSAMILDAGAEIGDVARRLGVAVPGEGTVDTQTIGGLLTGALGRIPVAGERFRLGGLDIIVVEAEPSHVRRVLVQRVDAAPPIQLRLPD